MRMGCVPAILLARMTVRRKGGNSPSVWIPVVRGNGLGAEENPRSKNRQTQTLAGGEGFSKDQVGEGGCADGFSEDENGDSRWGEKSEGPVEGRVADELGNQGDEG